MILQIQIVLQDKEKELATLYMAKAAELEETNEDEEVELKTHKPTDPLSFPNWEARFSKLPKETLNELKLVGDLNDPQVWIQSVEQTAYRLALVLSGSLDAVVHLMKEVPSPSQDPLEDRLYKLLLFAVSRPYLELRQSLGLNLQLQL